jgi:hypothetical protein
VNKINVALCKLTLKSYNKEFTSIYEKFEDTKGVIRILKSKDKQYNGQKDKKSLEIPKG